MAEKERSRGSTGVVTPNLGPVRTQECPVTRRGRQSWTEEPPAVTRPRAGGAHILDDLQRPVSAESVCGPCRNLLCAASLFQIQCVL